MAQLARKTDTETHHDLIDAGDRAAVQNRARDPRRDGAGMKLRIEGHPRQRLPRTHVTERLSRVLPRMPFESLATTVTFSDLNGPRGGHDIRCTLTVDLPRTAPILVEGRGPTPTVAFDVGYDRLVRRLARERERWRDQRRHPKKYFAAKRMQ